MVVDGRQLARIGDLGTPVPCAGVPNVVTRSTRRLCSLGTGGKLDCRRPATYQYADDPEIGDEAPIAEPALVALKEWRTSLRDRGRLEELKPDAPVFGLSPTSSVRKSFKNAAKRAGLPGL